MKTLLIAAVLIVAAYLLGPRNAGALMVLDNDGSGGN